MYCGQKTQVVNTRHQKRRNSTWRRRECTSIVCKAVFTSIENADLASTLVVMKRSGHLEPFQRDILLLSIYDSLRHRKTAITDASDLTDTIIQQTTGKQATTISTELLSQTAYTVLLKFDHAAAVHYQAYFLN